MQLFFLKKRKSFFLEGMLHDPKSPIASRKVNEDFLYIAPEAFSAGTGKSKSCQHQHFKPHYHLP